VTKGRQESRGLKETKGLVVSPELMALGAIQEIKESVGKTESRVSRE
jgi:hypothetical protein